MWKSLIFPVAPDGPPRNLTASMVTSNNITLTWYPPIETAQNARIAQYIVRITATPFPVSNGVITFTLTSIVYPATESVTREIPGLEEANTYAIMVEAINVEGSGPSTSTIFITTNDSGLLFKIYKYSTC